MRRYVLVRALSIVPTLVGVSLAVFLMIRLIPGTIVEQMIGMSGIDIPARSARGQIASAINVVVQVQRLSDGRRQLLAVSELTGMEGDVVTMQDIFRFRQTGVDGDGKVIGRFRATGVRPRCCERLKASGIHLPADMFEGVTEVR